MVAVVVVVGSLPLKLHAGLSSSPFGLGLGRGLSLSLTLGLAFDVLPLAFGVLFVGIGLF